MKKLIIGALLLLLLTGIAVWVTQQNRGSTIRSELTDFAIEDTASITRIIMKSESGRRVELSRDDEYWLLDGEHIARPDAIKTLLTTIKKLAIKAPIGDNQKNSVLKNIIAGHTLVEIYDHDDLVKTYYVGGPDKEHTGTFMMIKGSSRPYLVHIEGFQGFLTERFFTNANEWKHRGIFEYNPKDIASLEIRYPEMKRYNFTIERDQNGDYEVYVGDPLEVVSALDTFMLSAYLSNYKMIHYEGFEEVKSKSYVDSVMQSTPIFVISLTDIKGKTTTVEGFKKPMDSGLDHEGNPIDYDLDRLYLRIDSEKIVVGQYVIFDRLTKGIGFLKNG